MYKHIINVGLALNLFLVLNIKVKAQEEIRELTWPECVAELKQNNTDLKITKIRWEESKLDFSQAQRKLWPSINSSVGARASRGPNSVSSGYTYSLSLEQSVSFDKGEFSFNLDQAKTDLQLAEMDFNWSKDDLLLSLKKSFISLLGQQKNHELLIELLAENEKDLKLVELRYKVGRENRGVFLQTQAQHERDKQRIKTSKYQLFLAKRAFSQMLGRENFQDFKLKGEIEFNPEKYKKMVKPDIKEIIENHPSWKKKKIQTEKARRNLYKSKAAFYPSVSAVAGYSDNDWPPDKDKWSISINLSLPLYQNGERFIALKKAKNSLIIAEIDEKKFYEQLFVDILNAWHNFENALIDVEIEKKYLIAMQEREKIAKYKYTAGIITFSEWEEIKEEAESKEQAFLDIQTNVIRAELDWKKAQGGKFFEEE